MFAQNNCSKFKMASNRCPDVWGSPDASDILIDILEVERQCRRDNGNVCTKSAVDQLKEEERSFWDCLDQFCGKNSDRLVKSRKQFVGKLDKAFHKFRSNL